MPNDCGPILCTCTTLFDTTLPRLTVFGGARTPKGAAVLIFWGSEGDFRRRCARDVLLRAGQATSGTCEMRR